MPQFLSIPSLSPLSTYTPLTEGLTHTLFENTMDSVLPTDTQLEVEVPETKETRELASVVLVSAVLDHPDADKLAVAQVKGWNVVTNKERDNYQPGDLAVYMEIDTVIPEALLVGRAEHEILKKKNFIVKTAKIRGQISQGILFKMDILAGKGEFAAGDNVTEVLGVTKHDTEALFASQAGGSTRAPFPSGVPKTEEERIQNMTRILQDLKGATLYATEKLDGSSFTCVLRDGKFSLASRNMTVGADSMWGEVAARLNLEKLLQDKGVDVALQGEMIGPKVQDNRYALKERTVKFFSVFDVKAGKYMSFLEAKALVEGLGLQFVPVVKDDFVVTEEITTADFIQLADGKSLLNPKTLREGLVFRAVEEAFHATLGRVSFKAISNQFLVKQKDK